MPIHQKYSHEHARYFPTKGEHRLGVHSQDGFVHVVTSTDPTLAGREVVVTDNGQPQKMIWVRPHIEGITTKYALECRAKTRDFFVGTACEVAPEALGELGRMKILLRQAQGSRAHFSPRLSRAKNLFEAGPNSALASHPAAE